MHDIFLMLYINMFYIHRISFVKINGNVNVLKYVIKNLKQAPTRCLLCN